MKVMKFGGSSLADSQRIKQTVSIIKNVEDQSVTVILSAMKGVTNLLIDAAEKAESGDPAYKNNMDEIRNKHFDCIDELFNKNAPEQLTKGIDQMLSELKDILHGVELVRECSLKTKDIIMSFGERMNCFQFASYMNSLDIKSDYIDARSIIKTDGNFGKGNVQFETSYKLIRERIELIGGSIGIVTGFIASDTSNRTTTLGRNGSDYTASIVGAALEAKTVEIWTDVDGVLTADPRIVENAYVIPQLSIQEAMELSYFGAEVIHPYTLIPTIDKKIPVFIKNTLNPTAQGTIISEKSSKKDSIITGIASIDKVSLINIEGGGMVGIPGIASVIFNSLAEAGVNIIMITQASSEHSISILCRTEEVRAASDKLHKNLASDIESKKIQNIEIVDDLVIIAVIGENMIGTIGLSGKLFSAVAEANVNILAIAQGSSERNISFVIHEKDKNLALNEIHKKFIG